MSVSLVKSASFSTYIFKYNNKKVTDWVFFSPENAVSFLHSDEAFTNRYFVLVLRMPSWTW